MGIGGRIPPLLGACAQRQQRLPVDEKQQAANPWFFILSYNYTMSDSFAPRDGKLSIMQPPSPASEFLFLM
jgi:hypothetical protein